MHNITTPIFADYVLLWILVEATPFNPLDLTEDENIWTPTANGAYSRTFGLEQLTVYTRPVDSICLCHAV
jgi:hypothetical protein